MNFKTMAVLAATTVSAIEGNAMKVNDTIHNFKVTGVTELDEVPGKLWRMEYAKNGAELVWLERDDDNKTFGIAFKTIPEDDTGVAHIMEHSVLCGSEKYPVKEPFVDLLKSSLATFLNAMTYPDKTVYPVATRNDADFLNLIDVYMDAVLNPISIKNRMALDQEGWHYEFDGDKLVRNGVVYSEMKGVFSNPDSVAFWETMKLLFPDCCYSRESGGDPNHIPELTFEMYKNFHRRFYHPSNARIFIDGKANIEDVLAKLDGYLCRYDKAEVKADIPFQTAVAKSAKVPYEVGEDNGNKYILTDGWVIGKFSERKKQLAFSVLSEALAGSNESPLKAALLDKGLCEDVEIGAESVQQTVAMLTIRNTSEKKAEECRKTVRETLAKLAKDGLDRNRLEAILNHCEFLAREKDSGTYPRGIAFLEAALENWMYGGDPAEGFRYRKIFGELRKEIAEGGFEKYLKEFFIDNPHHAELTLVPSKTLGEERRKADAEALAKILSGWDAAKRDEVAKAAKELKALQSKADSPEDVAKLPKLKKQDIPAKGRKIEERIFTKDGCTVIMPKVGADGIFYMELYFALTGMTDEELKSASFFTTLLGETATARHSALELKSEIDGNLGRFGVDVKSCNRGAYVVASVAALEHKKADAIRILKEVLCETTFADEKAANDLLKQEEQDMVQSVATSGNKYAMRRAGAGLSRQNAIEEMFSGIDQLRWLEKTVAQKRIGELLKRYREMAKKVFVKDALTVCVTDNMSEEYVGEVIAAFDSVNREGGDGADRNASGAASASEGFVIPAEVGYAGVAAKLPDSVKFHGSQIVAARILTLDYLWNEIRVLGGAYGMGLVVRPDGDIAYMTYRDPNPARSLGKIAVAGEALENFCKENGDIDKYVVSAIGKTEPYLSPRLEAEMISGLYLAERTSEDVERVRSEILATGTEDVKAFAKVLADVSGQARVCVVGGKKPLSECKLEKVENVESQAAVK